MLKILGKFYDKINFRENAILALAFYMVTSFVYSDLGIFIGFGVVLLGIYMILEFIQFLLIDKESFKSLFKNKGWLYVTMLLLVIYISTLNRITLDTTKLYYLIIAFISFIIGILSTNITERVAHALTRLIVIAGTFVSSLIYFYKFFPSIYQQFIFPILSEASRVYIIKTTAEGYSVSISGEISYTLILIILGILFLCFNYDFIKKYKFKIFLFLYMFVSVILSQRRTELLFLTCTLVVGFSIKYADIIKNILIRYRKMIICLSVLLFLVIMLFVGYIYSLPENFQSSSRIFQTFVDLRNGFDITNGRLPLYQLAIHLFMNNLFFGLGWMNFANYSIITGNTNARNVHCIYLQLIAENGIVFGSLIIGMFAMILKRTLKALQKYKYVLASFCLQFYLFTAGVIDNTIYYPYFWILYMICVCLALKNELGKDKNEH